MLVAISGPAGSGKTTLARLLSEKLGLKLISTGLVFRRMASDRGMDVLQFNLLAEKDHSIDTELDRRVVEEASGMKNCIVEARLACLMLKRAGLEPYCIYVTAAETVRASRISQRDGTGAEESLSMMRAREESERRRYMDIYSMDPTATSIYDLLLDSENSSPEELAAASIDAMRKKGVV